MRKKQWFWSQILFFASVVFFLGKSLVPVFEFGERSHFTDATSEEYIMNGAKNFIEQGFAVTWGLPKYDGTMTETPVKKIYDMKVYTHFLPGPDYLVAGFYKIFGINGTAIKAARIFSILILFIALLVFSLRASRVLIPSSTWTIGGPVFFFTALWTAPAVYKWSGSLFGHPLSSAMILFSIILGFSSKTSLRTWVLAIGVGVISNLFLLEGAFVTAAGPLIGALLAGKCSNPNAIKRALGLSVAVGVGLLAIWLIHFAQVAFFLESWTLAIQDQIGTALSRGDIRENPTRIQMLGRVSEAVGSHFRVGAFSMFVFGGFCLWLACPKKESVVGKQLMTALLIAGFSSYCFPLLMVLHSYVHLFRVPRLFLLEYVVFITVTAKVIQWRVGRQD